MTITPRDLKIISNYIDRKLSSVSKIQSKAASSKMITLKLGQDTKPGKMYGHWITLDLLEQLPSDCSVRTEEYYEQAKHFISRKGYAQTVRIEDPVDNIYGPEKAEKWLDWNKKLAAIDIQVVFEDAFNNTLNDGYDGD